LARAAKPARPDAAEAGAGGSSGGNGGNDGNGGSAQGLASGSGSARDLLASRRISMHKKHIVKEKRQENASKLMDDLMQTGQLAKAELLPSQQVLLGVVAISDQPKPDVVDLIEHFNKAGVRFAYLSSSDAQSTLAFGGKIGMLSDFNRSISLKDPRRYCHVCEPKREVPVNCKSCPACLHPLKAVVEGRSKLPRGISGIREHIRSVDNVPLLLSLFTDCKTHSMKEMIRIYQENGETVFCLGSSLKADNAAIFEQADLAASLDPTERHCCEHDLHAPRRGDGVGDYCDSLEFAQAKAFSSLPCAFPLMLKSDLRQLSALVCEGRRLLTTSANGLVFCFGATLATSCASLCAFVLDLPPLLRTVHVLWLVWVVLPALALSLMASPRELGSMARMPDKNFDHLAGSPRWLMYFAVRFFPSSVLYVAFFALLCRRLQANLFDYYLWGRGNEDFSPSNLEWQSSLQLAQNTSFSVFVLALCVLSSGFVSRTLSLRVVPPWHNKVWLVTSLVLAAVQVAYFASINGLDALKDLVDAGQSPGDNLESRQTFWPLLAGWLCLMLVADELAKVLSFEKSF